MVISGTAMAMAWMKLRRRSIAPLLNANGWAINAEAKISIPFGNTLTDMAKFPALKLPDPYKKRGTSGWSKFFLALLVVALLAGVVVGLMFFNVINF